MLSGCFSRLKSFGFKLLIAAFLVLSILLLIASVGVFSSYELLTIRLYLFFAVASLVPPFLVKKKLIKILVVLIALACLAAFAYSFLLPTKLNEEETQLVKIEISPVVERMLTNYNKLDYEAFSKDFVDDMKVEGGFTEAVYLGACGAFGKFVSKPDDPLFVKKGEVVYGIYDRVDFSRLSSRVEIGFTKLDGKYQISGLAFQDPREVEYNLSITINSRSKLSSLKIGDMTYQAAKDAEILVLKVAVKNGGEKPAPLRTFKYVYPGDEEGTSSTNSLSDLFFLPDVKEVCNPIRSRALTPGKSVTGCLIYTISKGAPEGEVQHSFEDDINLVKVDLEGTAKEEIVIKNDTLKPDEGRIFFVVDASAVNKLVDPVVLVSMSIGKTGGEEEYGLDALVTDSRLDEYCSRLDVPFVVSPESNRKGCLVFNLPDEDWVRSKTYNASYVTVSFW